MTEHPADLFTAANAAREAKIVAKAFAYGPLGPRENNVLQGILRRAWEADAKAADARLGRMANVGAECVKTGSRGHAGRRERVFTIPVHVKAAQERDAAALRYFKRSQMTMDDLANVMAISQTAAKTAIARLRRDKKIAKCGMWQNFAIYGVVK